MLGTRAERPRRDETKGAILGLRTCQMYKELRLKEARRGEGEGVGAQRRAEKSCESKDKEQIPGFCPS